MIEFPDGGRMLQDVTEIPNLPDSIETLYLDLETTSGDPKKASTNPWFDCHILGIAFTFDDCPYAWYYPMRHRWGDNLPIDVGCQLLRDLFSRSKTWANHNVKYDAHVCDNSGGINTLEYARRGMRYRCTLTQAKIIDSDRYTYSIDALARDWLPEDKRKRGQVLETWLHKTKDYGDVPADIMAFYACGDVIVNRALDLVIDDRMHPDCREVSNTEMALTEMLINAERIGVCVDQQELKIEHMKAAYRCLQIEEELNKLTGTIIRPHVNDDCFDLLCNRFGLPVLGWTKGGKDGAKPSPSFDKDTLKLYLALPDAPKDLIRMMLEHRKLNTFISLFAEPYQTLNVDGVMHAWFNQSVRTGRMSASKPNLQQLSYLAKALIHPHRGHYFQTHDYSQIEFRFIVHYIGDKNCIRAYNEDPYTDFHSWVADMCNIKRKPAKTVNFMMGYGGGKKRTVKVLSTNEDVAEIIENRVANSQVSEEQRSHLFKILSKQYAEEIYDTYHATLPTLKSTSRQAETVCRRRGYVRNWYGRHRKLPSHAAHRAFNTVCQASAADLLKERAVAVYYATRGTGIEPVGLVHDEFLMLMPNEYWDEPRAVSDIVGILEAPSRPLLVPVRTSYGRHKESWAAASADADMRDKAGERVVGTHGNLEWAGSTS